MADEVLARARELLARLSALGHTLGTAESLTGGLLCARLIDVPGASAVVRGGIVSYATQVKADLLGVGADVLANRGAVDPEVALAMAQGAARILGCDWALATTGVAGPDPADGAPLGTVYVAVRWPAGQRVRHTVLSGNRAAIRAGAVREALDLALECLDDYCERPVGSAL